MDPQTYSTAFKVSYLLFIIPTVLVSLSALLSVKEMGGTLGEGLKKIAAGSIIHTTLIMTFLTLERGHKGMLSDYFVRLFFLFSGILGSALLISGYFQIYKITKKLKLFTS